MKPLSHTTDARMVKALAHPVRVGILAALERRTASPSELAAELDMPIGTVSYHVRRLAGSGLIKLEKEARRRGAVEHYYRLDRRPSLREKAWSEAPDFVKEALARSVLEQVSEQVNDAAVSGGFTHDDMHLSRLPLTLDRKGFAAAARELDALVTRLKHIEEESRRRLRKDDHADETNAIAVLMLFEAAAEKALPRPRQARRRTSREHAA
ncbi:MAG: helix-turn-helix domain-containing protein [Thermoleophilaceae bacterium]